MGLRTNRTGLGANNPNITQVATTSGIQAKIKRARLLEDEEERKRFAHILSDEEEETK